MTKSSESREQVRVWFVRDFTPEQTADRTGLPLRVVERHFDALLDETGGGKTPDYHLDRATERGPEGARKGPGRNWTERPHNDIDGQSLRRFGGAQPAHHKGPPKEKRVDPNDTSKCGTLPGYRYHIYHRTPPCDPCKQANALRQRQPADRATAPTVTRVDCGTYNGWAKHARRKEQPCAPCQKAKNDYSQLLRTRAAQAAADEVREDPNP